LQPYNGPMEVEYDAIIVGRGLVGMAAARALAIQGLRVALVGPGTRTGAGAYVAANSTETNVQSDVEPDLRVYALSPGSVGMLADLKVWPAVNQHRVAMVTAMQVFSPRGDELGFASSEAKASCLNFVVEHSNLRQALQTSLEFSNAVITNDAVSGLSYEGRMIHARLAGGEKLKARLIVAADGVESSIRGLANISVDRKSYSDQALVANLQTDEPHKGIARQWFTEKGVIALLPMFGERRLSLVWSGASEIAGYSARELGAELTSISGAVLGQILVSGETKSFPLQWLKAQSLVAPRVVLLGDAAHAMHPLAGQGLNLGFGDLAALLNLLAQRMTGQDIGEARFLRRYQRQRLEPVEAMLFVTDQLHDLFTQPRNSRIATFRRTAALMGWGQLARPNPLARQVRKMIIQRALA
jgi:2-polyprenylphenol 6-hydroxylase